MPRCKYVYGRNMDIESSHSLIHSSQCFSLVLVDCEYLVLLINDDRCILSNTAIICLNETDKIELLATKNLNASVISFTPGFINPNLNYSVVRSAQYAELRQEHHYPGFQVFLERSNIYNGTIPIDKKTAQVFHALFNNIDFQLDEQPDEKWSCRSRSNLFTIFHLADQCYRELISVYSKEELMVDGIIHYIQLHLGEQITLGKMSDLFHINRTTLNNQLKKLTGFTLIDYVIHTRIEFCKYDLSFTELTMSEIADKYAFFDTTYFTKVFKSRVGITPMKYRQQTRSKRPNKTNTHSSFCYPCCE